MELANVFYLFGHRRPNKLSPWIDTSQHYGVALDGSEFGSEEEGVESWRRLGSMGWRNGMPRALLEKGTKRTQAEYICGVRGRERDRHGRKQ